MKIMDSRRISEHWLTILIFVEEIYMEHITKRLQLN
jgi:hypothetical protein